MIFFTLEGGDLSVARRGLPAGPAPFGPRAEYSQRFAASRRFAFKDLNEGSKVRAAVSTKSAAPKRLSRTSARLRRAIVRTIGMLIPGPFYSIRQQAMESWAKHD